MPLDERIVQLRKRLDDSVRPELRGDWTAYLEGLTEQNAARNTVLTKVLETSRL